MITYHSGTLKKKTSTVPPTKPSSTAQLKRMWKSEAAPTTDETHTNSSIPVTSQMPAQKDESEEEKLASWLSNIGLSDLHSVLVELGADGIDSLIDLKESDLEKKGVPPLKGRKLLRELSKKLDNSNTSNTNTKGFWLSHSQSLLMLTAFLMNVQCNELIGRGATASVYKVGMSIVYVLNIDRVYGTELL
jgi:hypothetical protein